MFGFVKKIFNKKSAPAKITALPQVMTGRQISDMGGYVQWKSHEYEVRLYAERNDNKSYSLKCAYNRGKVDSNVITLRGRISLAEAIADLRKYDNAETDRRMHDNKHLEYSARQQQIEKSRDDDNVRLVQNRLTASNPMRH